MKLLDSKDILDTLRDSITYQLQKMRNIEKNSESKEWYQELPKIVREKFENYKNDYEHLSFILKSEPEIITKEMKKGYYYWRLVRSACITYKNDLITCDEELFQEFGLQETEAISDNTILNKCIGILEQHVVER